MSSFSIWLIPREPEYSIINNLIVKLGEEYLTPIFNSHITLLGGINGSYDDILGKYINAIKENHNQIELDLFNISYENLWNRALYIKVQKTPLLTDLFAKTLKDFGYKKQNYMPHLSLMYGEFSSDIKSGIKQKINNSYPGKIIIGSADLYETESGLQYVKKWKKLKSIKIT